MSPVAELLTELDHRGVQLQAQGDRLRFRPRTAVSEALAEQLRHYKAILLDVALVLELVRTVLDPHARIVDLIPLPRPKDLPPDLRELWAERAAIMEHDGGLPRAEAERLALADVLGIPVPTPIQDQLTIG